MLIFASALAAIIPMVSYLFLIWFFDRYDREPFSLVLKNYLWGAIGAIILAIIGSLSISTFVSIFLTNQAALSKIDTILIAPFVEEITKGIFLLLTIRNIRFDNMTDGMVYGGAIGLGFGMTENFLYFISFGNNLHNWITIVIIRTLFSAVMHCVSTATFGAFLGYAKLKKGSAKIYFPLLGILIAMFIHFEWNLSISFQSTAYWGFLFMIFTIAIFITIYSLSIHSERKIIYNELLEESENGLLPIDHVNIISSPKRKKLGWVDESIRKLYIRASITLAFRKVEFKNSSGASKIFYQKDIEYYRNFIHNLLTSIRLN